ncbi:MAG: hypothetical protein JKY48_19475 [Flavobacteriales bacterium]|nr:hypothetical protein [Flavobacteriales bacterium]
MKSLLTVCILLSLTLVSFAQENSEYLFDQARAALAQREIQEGITLLKRVYTEEPNNANINFLMGAAFTELSGTEEEAMFHLKKAVQDVDPEYVVGSFQEKSAPIHVYYYLAVAYVKQNKCVQANRAFKAFKKHKDKVSKYYIDEVDRHMQKCPFKEEENGDDWDKLDQLPADYTPIVVVPEPRKPIDSTYLLKRGIVTEKLEYTTNAPLFGVQIGSNIHPSPTSNFSDVKNVDVFIDSLGIIRYVVGHFSYRKQAENLLTSIREKGFTDAYVVNVNNEKKYSNEVISYQNVNLRSGIRGEVEYQVQLGAFEDTIPADMLSLYFKIDGIQEYKREKKTIMAIGPYSSYTTALGKKRGVVMIGIEDAFIVAYNRGKRIPLYEAIHYTGKEEEDQ